MKKKYVPWSLITVIYLLFTLSSCHNTDKKKDAPSVKKNMPVKNRPAQSPARPPIINIVDTVSVKMILLCVKDSATTSDRIGMKIHDLYTTKLPAVITRNKLKVSGPPMAWYRSHKAPFFFEAGLPVNKKPGKLPKGYYIREIGVDSIIVAHFTGPYDMITLGYEVLRDWLKDHKKFPAGSPYEIYAVDPLDSNGNHKDPYKVQTDIVFPMKNRH